MQKTLIAAGLVAACFLATDLQAQESGIYFGGALGLTNLDEHGTGFAESLDLAGASYTLDIDDNDMGWKFFAGYQFNRNVGVEIGYTDLGSADLDYVVTSPADVTGSASSDISGFTADVVLAWPLADRFDVFAKAGLVFWDADLKANVTSVGDFSGDDDGTDIKFGLGARYAFTDQMSLRLEWERYNNVSFNKNDTDMFSVGFQFRY